MANVLITDGDERAALAVVRSLGNVGHRVSVVSASGRSIAGASKHCAAEHRLPDPLMDAQGFFGGLASVISGSEGRVLIPISEAALLAVLPRRKELEPAVIPFPAESVFRRVANKEAVVAAARELRISEPTLGTVHTREDLLQSAGRWIGSHAAIVLKPTRSVVGTRGGGRKTFVRYARSSEDLRRIAGTLESSDFPILVQRRVTGPGIGVFLFVSEGEVTAHFGHRRIREKPPSGGVSVLRESVEVPPDLLAASRLLLKNFDWEGVAMVEYKVDEVSGTPFLMEINGRFWGSLQLAIDAGVDFPRLLVEAGLGERSTPPEGYALGVQTRWLMGDVDHLLARLVRSRRTLQLGPDAPGRFQVALDFMRAFFPPVRTEVCRWNDPNPAVREAASWLRQSLRGRHG